ncbi:hypothetical protein [Pseudonocardia pini]|uniref:hypothetical protein n=1 Tax=Pseudonocardia pini TaxID=2758030 RepID=UPI0015F0BDCF|nr:hypothetical protein [Pseudonocardia pini]
MDDHSGRHARPLPETLDIDVQMWTSLRGHMHDFTTVVCDSPDPAPRDADEWHRWAEAHLLAVADRDGWQPGRYHFRAEIKDAVDRTAEVLTQDHWEYRTGHAP